MNGATHPIAAAARTIADIEQPTAEPALLALRHSGVKPAGPSPRLAAYTAGGRRKKRWHLNPTPDHGLWVLKGWNPGPLSLLALLAM